jgi:drug/metabolite transporter (DMT)-like permease
MEFVIILIILLQALYGCTFTISKILVMHASPVFVIGLRMFVAGFVLFLYDRCSSSEKYGDLLSIKSWLYLLQLGVIGTFIPYVLRYWSLQYLPVTKIALLYNLSPFASLLFSFIFFKEEVTLRKWIGLGIGFSSVMPILFSQVVEAEASSFSFGAISLPEIAMLFAVVCYAYGWIIMKKLVISSHLSPCKINSINMLIAGVLALIVSIFFEGNFTQQFPSDISFWMWFGLIILITNIICHNLYAILLKTYTVTLMSLAGLFAPVAAATTSFFYFKEIITWDYVVSGILVLIGFFMFYGEELKNM